MEKEIAMKRKRYSVEQIVAVLKQAELGMSVADLVRQTGITEQTFYRWSEARSATNKSRGWRATRSGSSNRCRRRTLASKCLPRSVLRRCIRPPAT